MRIKLFSLFLLVAIASVASAQTPLNGDVTNETVTPYDYRDGSHEVIYALRPPASFNGSVDTYVGTVSPIEKNDLFSATHVEQGMVFWRNARIYAEFFVSADVNFDTQGYTWANNIIGQGGLKFVKPFKSGVVAVSGAYADEDQWHGIKGHQFQGSVSDWFGWGFYMDHRFPGSTWAVVGNLVPVELQNVLGQGYIQQGFVAARLTPRIAIVPYFEGTLGVSSQHYDWDNFRRVGVGVKLMLPQAIEIGAAGVDEARFYSGLHADGFSVYIKFWRGWNLSHIGKGN